MTGLSRRRRWGLLGRMSTNDQIPGPDDMPVMGPRAMAVVDRVMNRLDTLPVCPHLAACACRKPVPAGQMLCGTPSARSRERCLAGRSWFGLACDDLRLVGLKLIFLVVTRAVSVLVWVPKTCATWPDAPLTARLGACQGVG